MATVHLQSPAQVTYSGAASVTASFVALTIGSLLIAIFTSEDTTGAVSVADNVNAGNYTQDALAQGAGGPPNGRGTCGVFSKVNASSSSATVTGTPAASSNGILKIYERSQAISTPILDSTATGTGAITTDNSITITTLTQHCSVYAVGLFYPAIGDNADPGYVQAAATMTPNSSYVIAMSALDIKRAQACPITFILTDLKDGWESAAAAYVTGPSDRSSYSNFPKYPLKSAT